MLINKLKNMESFEENIEKEKSEKLTKEDIINKLNNKESLENLILSDLDLSGLDLENQNFRGSDIRGMILYREEKDEDGKVVEIRTSIKGADFTDTTIADLGPEVFFGRADVTKSIFGYTENLIARRKRHKESGEIPRAEDIGGIHGFNGNEGIFRETRWINVDFGGGTGYEAVFQDADLSEAVMEACDLSGMDFSETNIDGIKIIDPISLSGTKINESQIETVIQAIQLSDQNKQAEFLEEKENNGQNKTLEDYFGMIIVKKEARHF